MRQVGAGTRLLAPVVAAVAAVLTSGCATYVASNVELRTMVENSDWQRALDRIDRREGGTDRLLELMTRGHVLHYAGRFDESNTAFQQAEDLAASLYTRSVSQQAASLIVNDLTIDYRGKPFELAMVPFYRAFNYLSLGDHDAAQVEARKASLTLADAVEATIREIHRPADRDAVRKLQDSGFLHWFAGMLFESGGAANDAFVAYRNAARAYLAGTTLTGIDPPTALGRDLERVGRAFGFRSEVDELRAASPELFPPAGDAEPDRGGEVVFVLESGWIAPRDQVILNVPILDIDRRYSSNEDWAWELVDRSSPGWGPSSTSVNIKYWLTVAVPTMGEPTTGPVAAVRLSTPLHTATSQPADELSRRAAATLDAELGQVLFKSLLRALVKYAATQAAESENSTIGGLVNLLGVLTERADTRCWLTLPDRLAVARLHLPPGRHEIRIDYLDAGGRAVHSETETVDVADGSWLFLNRRSFS